MARTKTLMRRQLLMLFCALLLFGQIFTAQAFADSRKDVNISYTVTEDMLPQASPTPTAKPVATPHPGKGEPPKTGDESRIMEYAKPVADHSRRQRSGKDPLCGKAQPDAGQRQLYLH